MNILLILEANGFIFVDKACDTDTFVLPRLEQVKDFLLVCVKRDTNRGCCGHNVAMFIHFRYLYRELLVIFLISIRFKACTDSRDFKDYICSSRVLTKNVA